MLKGNKYYDLAKKYMPNGTCGVITFGLKVGRETAIKSWTRNLLQLLITLQTHRSCVLHPASHTHTDR